MTFDDDFVQLTLGGGIRRFMCKDLGVSWPPPEFIAVESVAVMITFKRLRFSALTDEERAEMTNVCRGAEYVVDPSALH